MKYALQLYSVRDVCTADNLKQTLSALRDMGYEGVETAGSYGLSAEAFKAVLAECGLVPISAHERINRFEEDLDGLLDFYSTLGLKTVACSYATTSSAEEVRHVADVLSKATERAAARGMRVLYHNHSHEFVPIDGVLPITRIAEACLLEPDTYWIFNAKHDPVAFLRDNAARIGLVHLKDGRNGRPCTIGEGENAVEGILDATIALGHDWIVIENDDPKPDGLSDAARSIAALKALKK